MNNEKDYGKLNDELLGILVCADGEFRKQMAGGKHSTDYYVTKAVAEELAQEAPEVLNATKQSYLIIADNPNALVGKLARYLMKNIEFEETKSGEWKIAVPIWNNEKDE